MKRSALIALTLTIGLTGDSQGQFELGCSLGANAAVMRTVASPDQTDGYRTPVYPSTWTGQLYAGLRKGKNGFYLAYDTGTLGISWRARVYPEKYPYSDVPNDDGSTNLSITTGFSAKDKISPRFSKVSVLFKRSLNAPDRFDHKLVAGGAFLYTAAATAHSVHGSTQTIDGLGTVKHEMVMNDLIYYRRTNLYLAGGYECSFRLSDRWNIHLSFLYNQGMFKMLSFHTYRTYSESETGYSEYDEQQTVSRLSYFSLLGGVSFGLGTHP